LQEALAQSEEPLPVMFVTAHGDVSAMKKGAVDVFARPVRGDERLGKSFTGTKLAQLRAQQIEGIFVRG